MMLSQPPIYILCLVIPREGVESGERQVELLRDIFWQ